MDTSSPPPSFPRRSSVPWTDGNSKEQKSYRQTQEVERREKGGSRVKESVRYDMVNPFESKQRSENFPSWEEAFEGENHPNRSHAASWLDQSSLCSMSSSLNLSIGARAALAEHIRHIAKHGFDETSSSEEEEGAGKEPRKVCKKKNDPVHCKDEESFSEKDQISSRDQLDEQWERYLEGTTTDSSFLDSNPHNVSLFSSGPHSPLSDVILSTTNQDGEEEVEVMTAVGLSSTTSDFFYNSAVNLLQTPERVRHLPPPKIRGRGDTTPSSSDDDYDHPVFGCLSSEKEETLLYHSPIHGRSFDQTPPEESFGPTVVGTSREALAPDTSFASLSAVDASRISASLLDVSHISNDGSHHVSQPHALKGSGETAVLESLALSPISNRTKQSRILDERLQYSSSLQRQGGFDYVRQDDVASTGVLSSSFASGKFLPSLHISAAIQEEDEDARGQPELPETGNTLHLGEPLLGLSADAQISEVQYDRTHDSDISTLQNQSSSAKDTTSSSVSANQSFFTSQQWQRQQSCDKISQRMMGSDRKQTPLFDDRRKYRTVVPTRVFMDMDPSDFPEEHDSFSARASRPSLGTQSERSDKRRNWVSGSRSIQSAPL